MNPKKSKQLISEVAKDTPLSIDCIQTITNFYWSRVSNALTTLKEPKVHIDNLGDFTLKHWLLDKAISKSEAFADNTKKKSREKYMAGLDINQRIQLLYNIKNKIEKENQRKEFIYEHKKNSKINSKDMDGEMEDSRGSLE